MPKDDRTFITVDDGMPEHPKIEALSDAAFRAMFGLWCWCSRNKTDGKVPEATWRKRTTARIRKELMAAPLGYGPLIEPIDGGVLVHDYLEHQRSRAEIERLKEARAEAGRKGGRSKAQATAKASARVVAKQARSKPVADTEEVPDGTSQTDSSEADASGAAAPPMTAQTLLAEWIDHCAQPPVNRVKSHVARELKVMLEEGVPYEDVRAGLQAWHSRRLNPGALASVVHELRQGPPAGRRGPRPSPGEELAQTLDLGRRLAAEQNPEQEPLPEPRQIGAAR